MNRVEQLLLSTVVLVVLMTGGKLALQHYGAARFADGRADAIAERARADAVAVLARTKANQDEAVKHAKDNVEITKEKDNEIANLRERLAAAGRLRVGAAICADRPSGPAYAESPISSDRADSPGRLVSATADRDLKQLIADVEQDLATGRACQAFLHKNGFAP